jgi:hypothetical protein
MDMRYASTAPVPTTFAIGTVGLIPSIWTLVGPAQGCEAAHEAPARRLERSRSAKPTRG